jgi:energy-converting hydrogenase Eha subunit C
LDYFAAGILTLLLLVVVAILAVFRWEYGLALALASLSLVNRVKTEYFLDLGIAVVTAETVFILLLLFAWVIRVAKPPRLPTIKARLAGPAFCLFFSGLLSLLFSLDIRVSTRLLIVGVIEPIILFYLIINNIKFIRQVRLIVYALIASAVFATVYGLRQIFLTVAETGNPFDYRIVSVFYSPAIFAEILNLSFPLVLFTRISLQNSLRDVGLI